MIHVAASYEAKAVLYIIRNDPASAFTKTFLAVPEAEWETDPETEERWQVEDLQFDEVLGALAGDTDIELLWVHPWTVSAILMPTIGRQV